MYIIIIIYHSTNDCTYSYQYLHFTGRAVHVIIQPSDITDARLGCTYRLVCELADVTLPLLWLRSNQVVQDGQCNISVTVRESGAPITICSDILCTIFIHYTMLYHIDHETSIEDQAYISITELH